MEIREEIALLGIILSYTTIIYIEVIRAKILINIEAIIACK